MSNQYPDWLTEKNALDVLDDGLGPYLYWALCLPEEKEEQSICTMWSDFLTIANDHLGQGYSIAGSDGQLVDNVTAQAFAVYVALKLLIPNKIDAERYQWLRERSIYRSDPPSVHVIWNHYREGVWTDSSNPSGEQLDVLIDDQIKRSQ